MLVETAFPDHAAAVQAASPALRHVLWIGAWIRSDTGDQPGDQPGPALPAGGLSCEALIAQHRGAAPAEAVVSHDDPLWFFYTSAPPATPRPAS